MTTLTDADIDKLKVAELKEKLTNAGLDTKGNKAGAYRSLQSSLPPSHPSILPTPG